MDVGYRAAIHPGEDDSEVFEALKKKAFAVLNEEKQELKRKLESGSDYIEDRDVGFYQDPPFSDDISQCDDEDEGF